MPFDIKPTSGPYGAVVTGLDVAAVSDSEVKDLYKAYLQHGVLVFKGKELDVPGQVALTRLFGEPEIHPIEHIRYKEDPHLITIAANRGQPVAPDDPDADKITGIIPWHSDLYYTDTPSRGSLLRLLIRPQEGGNTGFIDTARVYRELPYPIKCKIQPLQIVHSYAQAHKVQSVDVETPDLFPEAIVPLVSVHPENDLPVLNISPSSATRIVGLPEAEAAELLAELIAFATADERAYVHQWEPGDAVLWDNWRTIHRAYGHRKRYPRFGLRATLKADMKLGRWISNGNSAQVAAE